VSAGVLTLNGKTYIVVVGEHLKKDKKNGVTMIYDISAQVCVCTNSVLHTCIHLLRLTKCRSPTQVWYEGSKRPFIGSNHAAEVINNKLYLFGGISEGQKSVQIGTLKTVSGKVNISWKKGASIPTGSGAAATAFIGGQV
jgi:hypothetical protein